MNIPIIDAHIHVDKYETKDRREILQYLMTDHIEALIAVSANLQSAKDNLELTWHSEKIKPAFGFHPEQPLPTHDEITSLLAFMTKYQADMVAVGEVGLPYYLRRENPLIDIEPYTELLEIFIQTAQRLNKPIILHAVYDDAPIVCDLLEKHAIKNAHFHWFKGDDRTIERMIANEYCISITPDVLYEQDIHQLVQKYPLQLMMVETDGPWPFSGPFKGELTHPKMIHQVIKEIAYLKNNDLSTVYRTLYDNTKRFYQI